MSQGSVGIEAIKQGLLLTSDWLGLSASQPVRMHFVPADEMAKVGRHRRSVCPKHSTWTQRTQNSQKEPKGSFNKRTENNGNNGDQSQLQKFRDSSSISHFDSPTNTMPSSPPSIIKKIGSDIIESSSTRTNQSLPSMPLCDPARPSYKLEPSDESMTELPSELVCLREVKSLTTFNDIPNKTSNSERSVTYESGYSQRQHPEHGQYQGPSLPAISIPKSPKLGIKALDTEPHPDGLLSAALNTFSLDYQTDSDLVAEDLANGQWQRTKRLKQQTCDEIITEPRLRAYGTKTSSRRDENKPPLLRNTPKYSEATKRFALDKKHAEPSLDPRTSIYFSPSYLTQSGSGNERLAEKYYNPQKSYLRHCDPQSASAQTKMLAGQFMARSEQSFRLDTNFNAIRDSIAAEAPNLFTERHALRVLDQGRVYNSSTTHLESSVASPQYNLERAQALASSKEMSQTNLCPSNHELDTSVLQFQTGIDSVYPQDSGAATGTYLSSATSSPGIKRDYDNAFNATTIPSGNLTPFSSLLCRAPPPPLMQTSSSSPFFNAPQLSTQRYQRFASTGKASKIFSTPQKYDLCPSEVADTNLFPLSFPTVTR